MRERFKRRILIYPLWKRYLIEDVSLTVIIAFVGITWFCDDVLIVMETQSSLSPRKLQRNDGIQNNTVGEDVSWVTIRCGRSIDLLYTC